MRLIASCLAKLKFSRWSSWAIIVGAIAMGVSITGVLTTHPLTLTTHSALHLLGVPAGLLMIIGITGFKLGPNGRLGRWGWVGFDLMIVGLALFIVGNLLYAILHGWLRLVGISDPIHQTPLNLYKYVLASGAVIFALTLLKYRGWTYWAAWLLILGSGVLVVGVQIYSQHFYRQRDLIRHAKASLIVLPFVLAWLWLAYNNLRSIQKSGKTD